MVVRSFQTPTTEVLNEWKEWSTSRLSCDATMLVIAPRGAGKTTFIIDCTHFKGNTKRGLVICPTPELYKTYGEHFPMLFCHQHFDEEFEQQLESILGYQEQKSI
jgi:reverse gyrase